MKNLKTDGWRDRKKYDIDDICSNFYCQVQYMYCIKNLVS